MLNRSLKDGICLQTLISEVARHYLERASSESGGNITKAAKLLGFESYQTFSNWAKKHDAKVGTPLAIDKAKTKTKGKKNDDT